MIPNSCAGSSTLSSPQSSGDGAGQVTVGLSPRHLQTHHSSRIRGKGKIKKWMRLSSPRSDLMCADRSQQGSEIWEEISQEAEDGGDG